MKLRFTTSIEEKTLELTRERAKDEGLEANAIIEKALKLYFESCLPNEVWEKVLPSGWVKKLSLHDDGILFENIKCRKNIENYKSIEYTEKELDLKGWKRV